MLLLALLLKRAGVVCLLATLQQSQIREHATGGVGLQLALRGDRQADPAGRVGVGEGLRPRLESLATQRVGQRDQGLALVVHRKHRAGRVVLSVEDGLDK